MRLRSVLLVAFAFLTPPISATGVGQMGWQMRSPTNRPSVRWDHAMAYDEARQRVVLFGGQTNTSLFADTWEWDGQTWTKATANPAPPPRHSAAMAYDAARRRIVLFGGADATGSLGDTWEWDGTTWTQATVTTAPSPRQSTAIAYDTIRQRIVLFGGVSSSGILADTWEWDGAVWRLRASTGPSARYDHAMAYDRARQRTVLAGGWKSWNPPGTETWEWNGTVWTKRQPANSPGFSFRHSMAYDIVRQRIVMQGGWQNYDTWEWDGANWSKRGSPPTARGQHAMAYDHARQQSVLFGGYPNFSDTLVWDGATWRTVNATTGTPPPRHSPGIAYDPVQRRTLVFGGQDTKNYALLNDLWQWDGQRWTQLQSPTSPSPRVGARLTYDAARRRLVLFGGASTAVLGDTWEWDGARWQQLTPTSTPTASNLHGMVFDPTRARTVLFDSNTATVWEWNGVNWAARPTTASPPPRAASIVYDAVRRRIVLHGGLGTAGFLTDTWAWNGTTWTQLATPTSPTPRTQAGLAFDAARDRIVLFGGWHQLSGPHNRPTCRYDSWEFDGTTWRQTAPRVAPSTCDSALIHDADAGETLLFTSDGELWAHAPRDLVASQTLVSVATGGPVPMAIDAGRAHANKQYWLLGCIDGSGSRGLPLTASVTLMLYPDAYFAHTLANPNTQIVNSLGTLDASGRAAAAINVPRGLPRALVGTRLYHAYVVFQNRIDYASTPVPMTFIP